MAHRCPPKAQFRLRTEEESQLQVRRRTQGEGEALPSAPGKEEVGAVGSAVEMR